MTFEFNFRNEFRGVSNDLGLFLPYVALPPITALDGNGSQGLGFRQRYSVTMVKGGQRTVLADGLIAAPSNVGPRTMPDYDALAAQALYSSANSALPPGVRVFAGQRDDPFYIDLGAVFDTLNLRSPGHRHALGLQRARDRARAPGDDGVGGPERARRLREHQPAARLRPRRRAKGTPVQVQRLANPLVNEAIIGTKDKDRWNATEPEDEASFLDYYTNLRLGTALQAVFGAPAAPLLDVPESAADLRLGGRSQVGAAPPQPRRRADAAREPAAADRARRQPTTPAGPTAGGRSTTSPISPSG